MLKSRSYSANAAFSIDLSMFSANEAIIGREEHFDEEEIRNLTREVMVRYDRSWLSIRLYDKFRQKCRSIQY